MSTTVALEDLVRLCVELDKLRRHDPGLGHGKHRPTTARGAPRPDTTLAWEALEQAVIARPPTSCPVRTAWRPSCAAGSSGARLGGPSLPLDIGYSQSIPAGIRNAVILRDKHCQWAGRCHQPAMACEGPPREAQEGRWQDQRSRLFLLCWYHHQIVIHRWGWTPGPEPRRNHHRVETRTRRRSCTANSPPDQAGVTPRGSHDVGWRPRR